MDSPPFRLAQALATLTEPDGGGCRVDGLAEAWAYRKPLPPEEQRLLDALAHQYAGRDWREVLPLGGPANVPIVRGGVDGRAPLINFLYGPSLNVAGLRAGFLGSGHRHDPVRRPPRRDGDAGPPLGGRALTR